LLFETGEGEVVEVEGQEEGRRRGGVERTRKRAKEKLTSERNGSFSGRVSDAVKVDTESDDGDTSGGALGNEEGETGNEEEDAHKGERNEEEGATTVGCLRGE
jgi:hypothetical protein